MVDQDYRRRVRIASQCVVPQGTSAVAEGASVPALPEDSIALQSYGVRARPSGTPLSAMPGRGLALLPFAAIGLSQEAAAMSAASRGANALPLVNSFTASKTRGLTASRRYPAV